MQEKITRDKHPHRSESKYLCSAKFRSKDKHYQSHCPSLKWNSEIPRSPPFFGRKELAQIPRIFTLCAICKAPTITQLHIECSIAIGSNHHLQSQCMQTWSQKIDCACIQLPNFSLTNSIFLSDKQTLVTHPHNNGQQQAYHININSKCVVSNIAAIPHSN